ncbi:hypothetical protein [Dictyobacter formicarum]|uniref:hypothetical protein n=1 Tax=Dictyobacter formicarum TaxID=2778368 RepID=UPI001915CA16|nr:hypothetical protein [Dictyobacter formicarum]
MRSTTLRTDTLPYPDNVAYDCTAGSSVRREPHDDGDAIVVGGDTATQGDWESQLQGEGRQEQSA